ncbi:MAG: AAA family ATPase [Deltaproteobacteria bacterium]|nr:AAA family ATPase [Deltaproteobacteria bacterium]MBW1794581.1 AAA family ATPase [Deltaproteobacteria bacterium]
MEKPKNIFAIVGPKGGVGKSTISANLAIALSELGKRVIAVDLDLGTSNLHAIFGIRESRHTLDDFVLNRVKNLSDIVLDTKINNLGIICGGDVPGIANMAYQKKLKLIRHLSNLDCDLVLLDLAPGASYNVVDFLIIAQRGLLVTTPEVPSLLNVYSFIKATVFRRLTFYFKHKKCFELLELLEKAKDFDNHPHLKTMEGLFREARKIDIETANSAKKILSTLKPFVVVNRVQTENDANAGEVIQNLLQQYLSIDGGVTMTIHEDNAVKNAIVRMTPAMIDAPQSIFSRDINQIAAKIVTSQ